MRTRTLMIIMVMITIMRTATTIIIITAMTIIIVTDILRART